MVIRALPSNVGDIFIAPTAEMARDKSKALPLSPGEFFEFDHFGQIPTVFIEKSNQGDRMEVCVMSAGHGKDAGKEISFHVE